jgi:phospholipase/carboxylesterase
VKSGECTLGPLRAIQVSSDAPRALVILLHGYAMRPEDLEPFAHSLGISAEFYFPRGPQDAPNGARAWWPIDEERRSAQIAVGPRDLFEEFPAHRPAARADLLESLAAARLRHPGLPVVLGGFSQGGMLACDSVVVGGADVDALVMLSASRLAFEEWRPRHARLRERPVFVSHGRQDADLAFSAGERLRDFCIESGARVTWQPFDGPHEIPLVVWRALRRFLSEFAGPRT